MKIITIKINSSVSAELKKLSLDMNKFKILRDEYKISNIEYLTHKRNFKASCRELIPKLANIKMFHFDEDFKRAVFGKNRS